MNQRKTGGALPRGRAFSNAGGIPANQWLFANTFGLMLMVR